MATKAELEAELDVLRQQNEALRSKAEHTAEDTEAPTDFGDSLAPNALVDVLTKQGINSSDIEAIADQLADELVTFHKDHPLITVLGVFALGCIVGRAFR